MAVVTVRSDFGAQENKISWCFQFSSSMHHEVMGPDAMTLVFLNVEFQARFFTLLFHLHQDAVNFSSISAIRVVSSAYLRLLVFLSEILIPNCASSSPAFCLMTLHIS